MSLITVSLDYGARLWPEEHFSSRSYSWGVHSVSFGPADASLSTEFELSEEEQELLVRSLTDRDPRPPPHWQDIPAALHSTVLRIEVQLREAASAVDEQLRKTPSAIRLPIYRFPKDFTNQTPNWSTVHWSFNEEERLRLGPLFEHLDSAKQKVYRRGVTIPLPDSYEGRHVNLSNEQLDNIGAALAEGTQNLPPSRALYGVAWENFEIRSFSAAVVILATSIETALKWYLTQKGDEISGYLIEETQSPQLSKLLSCARKYAELNVPKRFQKWVSDLSDSRNQIAHRPVKKKLDPLEVARWFAVGEVLLKAIHGEPSDPLVGALVQISEKIDKFPKGTHGVVLRREEDYGEDSFHILLDSGVTQRFGPNAFQELQDQSF